jgi:hypothetical protein
MRQTISLGVSLLLLAAPSSAQDSAPAGQIESLKQALTRQQAEIDELRALLRAQQQLLDQLSHTSAAPPPPQPALQPPVLPDSSPVSPSLSLKLGGLEIAPTGFFELAQVWRTRTVPSGVPTNFAAVPFFNTVYGQRGQTISSAALSRFGLQVDTKVYGFALRGVAEADFLGYQPGNLTTNSNSYGLRLRLAFADLTRGKWEILGGQAWSLLTPGRHGISSSPSTLFHTDNIDPNPQSGLVWARSPQIRLTYHATDHLAMAVAFESADTYGGGSAGSGTIVLPSAFAPTYFNQIDNGSAGVTVPNPNSDFIAKIAFDPNPRGRSMHFEVAGLATRVAFFNPFTLRHFSITGGGVAINAGIEVAPHLTLFTNNYYSNGGGNFIFGEAPDLIIQGNGAPSLVPSGSTVNGLEYQASRKWILSAYYGSTYIGRRVTIDPSDGQPVGYGFTNSPNDQNRSLHQLTATIIHRLWQNPNYGTFQVMGEYSWIDRHPWYVAPGQPAGASLNMMYMGLRYVLPGAPTPK